MAVTDTTFRDAHQSLLATRSVPVTCVARRTASPDAATVLDGVLGAVHLTYDVTLRFLKEDPWQRLAKFAEAMPNIPQQMLLRGRNTVGYTPYPLKVTQAFVHEAARTGCDIFRIFDALNNIDQIRPAIEAVRETDHGVAEAALCYTGNLTSPGEKLYTLDYYLRFAEQLVEAARTFWRSRTWPACCVPRRRRNSSGRSGNGSTCPYTCTPTTPPAASWPHC